MNYDILVPESRLKGSVCGGLNEIIAHVTDVARGGTPETRADRQKVRNQKASPSAVLAVKDQTNRFGLLFVTYIEIGQILLFVPFSFS